MRNNKPQGTWTKVRRGVHTWRDYTVEARWTYGGRYSDNLMPYWAWFVTRNGQDLPGWHAIARQAKTAAEEHAATRVR